MNKTSAIEWLEKSWHNLSGAKLFYEAYPTFERALPSKEEIKEVLDFTEELFDKVCGILGINKAELK